MKSREIKFRVWNKTYGEMFYPKGPTKNGDYEEKIYLQLDGQLRGNFKYCGDVDCSDDYVLQQYTGLKDKNGVEIYEGDFLKYQHPSDEQCFERNIKNIVLVRWSEEHEDFHPGFSIKDTWSQHGDMEVIGNIFENPELLK